MMINGGGGGGSSIHKSSPNNNNNNNNKQSSIFQIKKNANPLQQQQHEKDIFESFGGRLVPFDDGHTPETFRTPPSHEQQQHPKRQKCCQTVEAEEEECSNKGKLVRYPNFYNHPEHQNTLSNSVRIYNDIFSNTCSSSTSQNVTDVIYDTTVHGDNESGTPWGTYVTVDEAMAYLNNETKEEEGEIIKWRKGMAEEKEEQFRHSLAVKAVAQVFLKTSSSSQNNTRSTNQLPLFTMQHLQKHVHGVAVWSLSSTASTAVQYHIDYAELIRYEFNVTIPPLWAGTLQCTRFDTTKRRKMEGGDFAVNLSGLQHYGTHGYKGHKSGDSMGGWTKPPHPPSTTNSIYHNHNTNWVTIPYQYNRAILHIGNLPHLSTPITFLDEGKKRVIMGFNAFGHDIGHFVQKAPEHSKGFRKKVKLHRSSIMLSAVGAGGGGGGACCSSNSFFQNYRRPPTGNTTIITNNKTKRPSMDKKSDTTTQSIGTERGMVSIEKLRQNKVVTKLLVLAKREKIKEELKNSQDQLTCCIWEMLLSRQLEEEEKKKANKKIAISSLIKIFSRKDGKWPSEVDTRVHIHHLIFGSNKQLVHHHHSSRIGSNNNNRMNDFNGAIPFNHIKNDRMAINKIQNEKYQIVCTLPTTRNQKEKEKNDTISNKNATKQKITNDGIIIEHGKNDKDNHHLSPSAQLLDTDGIISPLVLLHVEPCST